MDRLREAMGRALFLADKARGNDDVPVGAVVLDSTGRIIGQGWNQRELHHDPSAHAEIIALRDAGERLGRWNLVGCALVVTLEPCTMCAGAIVQARIDRVVFAAWDPKAGAAGSVRDVLRDSRLNHQVEVVGGVLEEEASIQLRGFFADRRSRGPASAGSAGAGALALPARSDRSGPMAPVQGPVSAPAAIPVPPPPARSQMSVPPLGSASRRRSWETSDRPGEVLPAFPPSDRPAPVPSRPTSRTSPVAPAAPRGLPPERPAAEDPVDRPAPSQGLHVRRHQHGGPRH